MTINPDKKRVARYYAKSWAGSQLLFSVRYFPFVEDRMFKGLMNSGAFHWNARAVACRIHQGHRHRQANSDRGPQVGSPL
jgi:hypothetical protein